MSLELIEFRNRNERWILLAALLAMSGVVLGFLIGHQMWLVVGVLAAIPLLIAWPVHVALGSFVLLIPFDSVASLGAEPKGRTLTWYAGLVTVSVLLAAGIMTRRLVRPPRAAFWWVCFMAWASMTALWAIDPDLSVGRFPTAWALLALYVVAVSFRVTRKELFWLSMLAILGGCVAAMVAANQFYSGEMFRQGIVNTRGSLLLGDRQTDPNYFAASLLLPISLAFGAFFSLRGKILKALMLAAAGVMSFEIFLTMSRGSLVALAVMGLWYMYRLKLNWRVLAILSALLFITVFLPHAFWQRVQPDAIRDLSGRLDIWTVGLVLIKRYALFGSGLDNFPRAYAAYAGYAPSFVGFTRAPHNVYLEVWIELGFLGFLFLALAILNQFRAARRARAAEPDRAGALPFTLPYEVACGGLMVAGLSVDLLWTKMFWLSWIFLALASRVFQSGLSGHESKRALREGDRLYANSL
jgi:O-antigen ligase